MRPRVIAVALVVLAAAMLTVGCAADSTASDDLAGALTGRDALFVHVDGPSAAAIAASVSQSSYPDGADTVLIATAHNWPDALCGTTLSEVLGAPLLLCSHYTLPEATVAEIERLGATSVIILGDGAVVRPTVERTFENRLGPDNVSRIGGKNRYETSRLIALEVVRVLRLRPEGYDGRAFSVSGGDFVGALAASPAAAAASRPIILTPPWREVDPSTVRAMRSMGVAEVVMVGDTGLMPESLATSMAQRASCDVRRIAGDTAYATAVAVAELGVEEAELTWASPALVTDHDCSYVVCSGALQANRRSVLLVTPRSGLDPAVAAALTAHRDSIESVTLFGGTRMLPDALRDAIEKAAR